MNFKSPELLAFCYFLLPIKHEAIAQILLSQIQAIHTARQAEEQLAQALDSDDQAPDSDEDELEAFDQVSIIMRDFLSATWQNASPGLAYSYLGLLQPHLGLSYHPVAEIRRKVARDRFEFSKSATDQMIRHQIQIDAVKSAIFQGELIADNPQSRSYLIRGLTPDGYVLHLKCGSADRTPIKIMAIYQPGFEIPNQQNSGMES
jgi:hypothetical protein